MSSKDAGQLEYREYFSHRRPSSFGERVLRSWHARMLRVARRSIETSAQTRVVEVGAGWGYFAHACREAGMAYEGIELDAEQARRLREEGLTVTAAAIPPFPAGEPAHLIWMSHVLEHAIDHQNAMNMVRAAHERLEPGGHVVIIGPDILSWREEFWNCDWSHGYPTSRRRVEQLLVETGFRVVASRSHVATLDGAISVAVLGLLFRVIPYRLIDAVLLRTIGRDMAYSFMAVFGWKQILVIGKKTAASERDD